jgi:hypothetical protein
MITSTATMRAQAQTDATWLRVVQTALGVGIAALVGFAVVGTFFKTSNGGDFTYTADYWYTAAGVPIALAGIGSVLGVHRLQHGTDRRLGTVGTWVYTLALVELLVQLASSVIAGAELRWGPMYVLCTALTFVGLALLAAGSWRTGLLPKWLLGVWPFIWIIGSFAAWGPMPLLLAAFYVVFGVILARRVNERAS